MFNHKSITWRPTVPALITRRSGSGQVDPDPVDAAATEAADAATEALARVVLVAATAKPESWQTRDSGPCGSREPSRSSQPLVGFRELLVVYPILHNTAV